jgi:hypothetical protein
MVLSPVSSRVEEKAKTAPISRAPSNGLYLNYLFKGNLIFDSPHVALPTSLETSLRE